jgi:hypothetical protein
VQGQLGERAEALGAVLLVLTEEERFTPSSGQEPTHGRPTTAQ